MEYDVCLGIMQYQADAQTLVEGMQAVKEAGFDAVEFFLLRDEDLSPILQAQKRLGLKTALFIPIRANLVNPEERGAFLKGLEAGIQKANLLNCHRLTLMAGYLQPDRSAEEQRDSLIQGLKAAAPLLEKAGITGVLEPLNQTDNKGYFLSYSDEAFRILEEVGSPHIKLLFDAYHQQIMEGNLTERITKNLDKIGHLHAAGIPGRHELDTGELNYPNLFRAVKAAGYDGYFGLEYRPTKDLLTSLKEARRLCV